MTGNQNVFAALNDEQDPLEPLTVRLGLEPGWDLDNGLKGALDLARREQYFGAALADSTEIAVAFVLRDGGVVIRGEGTDDGDIVDRPVDLTFLTEAERAQLLAALAEDAQPAVEE